jgi:GNAT superfamily N-acetyltransferase
MIRFVRGGDYPQVLRIWRACFGDEESYVRFFWENCFPLCRGLAYEADGRVVSMLFLLPCALAHKKMYLPAEYVYAVATLPEYRGRGYAAALVREAGLLAQTEGKSALCLRPADEGLYGYYAKLGFVKAFAKHEKEDRYGYFAWGFHMREYIYKESDFTGRELCQAQRRGGMLMPLDRRAEKWLKKTKGRARMGPALE